MHADLDIGLACCVVGCAALGILLARRRLRSGQHLSPETEKELDFVGERSSDYPPGTFSPQMPLSDLLVIYFESRNSRQDMHRNLLQRPHKDGAHYLEMVCEKHRKIRRLIFANLNERVTSILGLGLPVVSPRVLLRTFGEEQEVVSHLYKNCDPL